MACIYRSIMNKRAAVTYKCFFVHLQCSPTSHSGEPSLKLPTPLDKPLPRFPQHVWLKPMRKLLTDQKEFTCYLLNNTSYHLRLCRFKHYCITWEHNPLILKLSTISQTFHKSIWKWQQNLQSQKITSSDFYHTSISYFIHQHTSNGDCTYKLITIIITKKKSFG